MPQQVAQWLAEDQPLSLIDCRTREEHDIARIEGASLLPLHELPADVGSLIEDKQRRVVVFCHAGIRSLHMVQLLRASGIGNAISMAGGIDLWSRTVDPSVPRY